MAVLSGANEIMLAVGECARRTRDLRERMESDFSLWRLDPFQLGKAQGDYSEITSNAPAVLANRVVEVLSDARLRFVVPLADEDQAARARLALTERFVQGALNLADQRLAGMVASSVQQQLAWYATLRGWYAVRVYLREDADGSVVPDITVWDVLNTYWGMGAAGLAWACYRRYASVEQLRAEYGLETTPDEYGRVPVYDYWDDDIEAVIVAGEFVLPPTPHGLGRIPVLIGAVGAAPLVQSARYSDTLRNVGESVYANNRQLYPRQSEVMSYYLTITAMGARTPLVVYYSGDTPPEFENNPYAKGNVIFLKKDKEEARELLKADLPRDARLLLDVLGGQVSLGGLPPVAYGELEKQLPASGISLLTHSAQSILKPRRQALEKAFAWIAIELVDQYKSGGFSAVKLQGVDSLNRRFHVRIKPDDVCDDWRLEAELVPDMPQDELQNAGIATQLVKSKVISRQTAMDRYLHVSDPDAEVSRIEREQAGELPGVRLRRLAEALIDDGRADLAQVFLDEAARLGNDSAPETDGAPVPGIPLAVPPQAAVAPRPVLPPEA